MTPHKSLGRVAEVAKGGVASPAVEQGGFAVVTAVVNVDESSLYKIAFFTWDHQGAAQEYAAALRARVAEDPSQRR